MLDTILELIQSPEVLTTIGGLLAAGLTALLVKLRKNAKQSKSKLDDALVDVIDEAVEESKNKE